MDDTVPHYPVIVIGGGQAGLATAFSLQRRGLSFAVLDAEGATGDQWRRRWDSLRLFTPVRHSALPDGPWPLDPGAFASRDETADYLAAYARRHGLPVHRGVRVRRLTRTGSEFQIQSSAGAYTADAVIVATGATSRSHVPTLSYDLDPSITQVHSDAYRSPAQTPGERILVVGYGTSGAEIAEELAIAGRRVTLAGRPTAQPPAAMLRYAGELWWFFLTRVANRRTPIGRRIARAPARGAPLIRITPADVQAAGVIESGRIDAARDGKPAAGDTVFDVDTVVWATGHRGDDDWLEIANLQRDERGYPVAPFGRVTATPRLGFVGLPLQSCIASTLLGGVGRDAEQVVGDIVGALA